MFYLLHLGVLMVVLRYFSPVPAAVIGFALTVAMATVSWFALERPVLKLGTGVDRTLLQG